MAVNKINRAMYEEIAAMEPRDLFIAKFASPEEAARFAYGNFPEWKNQLPGLFKSFWVDLEVFIIRVK